MRLPILGYPVIHIDEQFYLLVGDRMLQGQLPFVDIWDRKPLGLFAVFAGIRMLGGDGIVTYQLVAMGCTALTSLLIYRAAREIASPLGAFWAGVAYQLALAAVFCFGGQAPVYYNPLVALAGLYMLRIYTAPDAGALLRRGAVIMLITGIAMQIKYTVVFEGGAFGLALLARGHAHGWHRGRMALAGLLWAGLALLPTAAALGWYAAMGHADAFVQANFLSIFGRHEALGGSLWRLTKEVALLTPVWCAVFLAPRRIPGLFTGVNPQALLFLRYWAGAAVVGFLIFGTWYDHYVAPLLVPLMICAAPALGQAAPWRWYTRLMIGLGAIAAGMVMQFNVRHHGTAQQVYKAAALIDQARGENGCVYINEGDPILYYLTNACFVTPYIFPNHLNGMVDEEALGVDAAGEFARTLARHPSVVITSAVPSALPVNWKTRAMLFQHMKRDYQLVGSVNVGWRNLLVYRYQQAAPNKPVLPMVTRP
ncbi:ArnT family glycosyltransferase [Novosphingobium ovatum]|nr:glycosyltransferase family 39 protein [Novosphingobium ovatum]